MLKNYLITACRGLVKQKGYLFINILGMAVGLASFIFISLYVMHERSFDTFHSNYENIYRIRITGQMSGQLLDQAVSAAPMAKALIDDYPEIDKVVRIGKFGAWLVRYNEKRFNEDGILFADSNFFDKDYNNLYKTETKTVQILGLFAILGIFIACLGLLGLISYTAAIRTKEIGIRKVLGASTSSIVLLLSKEVVRLIFYSTIIAWPLAYYSTNYWKQSYVDHVGFNPFDYLIATVAALIIGWLAIIFQAVKAALSNPVEALKYE